MEVKYIIKRNGTVEIDVEGGDGKNCLFTKGLEELLGDQIGERKKKPEFDCNGEIKEQEKESQQESVTE